MSLAKGSDAVRRLALTLLAACSASSGSNPDAGHPGDGAVLDGSADAPSDSSIDAGVDAMIDAAVDRTPPRLASVSPTTGASTWLHAPVRFRFDEPLDPASVASLAVSATIGGSAIGAQAAFDGTDTIEVTLDRDARGVGTLEVRLTGTVRDLADNATPGPFTASWMLPAWSGGSTNRGVPMAAPRLAVASDGTVYAAWIVGGAGAHRLVASMFVGASWSSLGGELGTADVTSAAVTLDEDGAPLIGWTESGMAHVAHWTGAWTELSSPGAGNAVALARPASGAPVAAVFGGTSVAVSELVSGAWQPIGAGIAIATSIAGEPSLAVGTPGHPVVGWVDTGGNLRAYRYDSSWIAIAALATGAGAHASLAARGSVVAVAWDQVAGSSAVLAAQCSGMATSWTRLGRALDVDLAANAVNPTVAIDASAAPIVAWTELIEGKQRGVIARWTGSAWSLVGGVDWLASTTAVPAAPRIALHAGDAPVLATAAGGAILVTRHNGPRTAALGIAARASRAGCNIDASSPPSLLSLTGCFTVPTPKNPVAHPGLVPYDIVTELWSDGALKRRWIGLPDGQAMTLQPNGSWVGPAGTMMVKEFAIETTPGNPATRRPVETRFFVNDASLGWRGFSYRWNAAGTDATLQPADPAQTVNWPMDDGSTHAHFYPSRDHCRSCHHNGTGPILGLRPEQLQRWYDYEGKLAPQISTLAAIGVGPASSAQPVASPHDPSETWERRMRGYMVANCQHCHNPQYINVKDLRWTTPLASTRLCEVITPGSPSTSRVYQLVTSRPGMPALGSLAVDPLARDTLGNWITGMTSCP
jgi:hypothetical protein